MSPVARCHVLYESHRRFVSDLRAMETGAFFAPIREQMPEPNDNIELRFHLPDGLRVDLDGTVMRATPGRGVIIGFRTDHPGLQAMRSAVRRPGFMERMHAENGPGAEPLVTFADPTATIPAQGNDELKREIKKALAMARARAKSE